MDFSPGYVDIEVTYTVRKESTLQSATEVNREGVVVASISSAGFMPVLIKSLTRAKLVRTGKIFDDIVGHLRDKSADAIVGLRPVLVQHSEKNPGFRSGHQEFWSTFENNCRQQRAGPHDIQITGSITPHHCRPIAAAASRVTYSKAYALTPP